MFAVQAVYEPGPNDRIKLDKTSRSACSSKHLARFYGIDEEKQSLDYYMDQNDKKPRKSIQLEQSVIKIESKEDYTKIPVEERKKSKVTEWLDDTCKYRVAIFYSQRDNKPVYTYTEKRD